jgi:hypothetical protein
VEKLLTAMEYEQRSTEKSIKIVQASSLRERMEIYRFRYSVYVEEMGKKIASPAREGKMLFDPMDERSILLYAHVEGEIAGTLRIYIETIKDFSRDMAEMFAMDRFSKFSKDGEKQLCAFPSKLMIAPAYRKSQALSFLLGRMYEIFRDYKLQFAFIGCNPHLIPLYEQIGFHRLDHQGVIDPGYGYLVPLILVVEDIEHFRAVRSPFFRGARKRENSPEAAMWFAKEFSELRSIVNSQLVGEDVLWESLTNKLKQHPQKSISIIQDLTEIEAKKFLLMGAIFPCKADEVIVTPGDGADELYILLSGLLRAYNPDSGQEVLVTPGQVFGECGLIPPAKQIERIAVVSNAEVLVIPRYLFDKIRQRNPNILAQIIKKIGR